MQLPKIDWMYAILILLGGRALYEASFSQALVIACFAGLVAYKHYLNAEEQKELNKQKELNEEVKTQLEEMKSTVAGLAMKNATKPAQMEQQIRRFF